MPRLPSQTIFRHFWCKNCGRMSSCKWNIRNRKFRPQGNRVTKTLGSVFRWALHPKRTSALPNTIKSLQHPENYYQNTATPPKGQTNFGRTRNVFLSFLLFFIFILDLADALENCNAQIQESKRGINTLFNPNLNPNPNRNPNNGRSSLRFLSLLGCIHSWSYYETYQISIPTLPELCQVRFRAGLRFRLTSRVRVGVLV